MGRSQMSWFNRFFKKGIEYETIQTDIPLTTIVRWYLYDTELVEPNEIAEEVGLSLVSEEGDVKEKEDSAHRIHNILTAMPYLETISNISANVLVSLHLKELEENNPSALEEFDSEIFNMVSVYKAVALSTLIGAFSIGSELDLFHITGITSDIEVDMEKYLNGE